MLILTRRPGEAIRIGEAIEIVVLDVVGQQVRLGVKAPREIAVDREEIYRAKVDNPVVAATGSVA